MALGSGGLLGAGEVGDSRPKVGVGGGGGRVNFPGVAKGGEGGPHLPLRWRHAGVHEG